jgi:hypothetical protein
MKGKFKEIVDKFPGLLNELQNSPSFTRDELKSTLDQGIYVFYENDIPMYVGRSGREGRFKTRILEHSRPSSGHNKATFAFMIAKEEADTLAMDTQKSRDDLQDEPEFVKLYTKAKERVSKMRLMVKENNDPIAQTLFEVYAALELNTPYNEWGTH